MLRHDTQGGVNPQDTLASIPKAPPSPKISEEDVGIDEQKIKSELDDVKVKTEVDNYKPTEPDSKPSDELSSPLSKIDAVSITPPEIPCPVKEERHERDPDYGAELDSQASNSDSESKDPDFTLPSSSPRSVKKSTRSHQKKDHSTTIPSINTMRIKNGTLPCTGCAAVPSSAKTCDATSERACTLCHKRRSFCSAGPGRGRRKSKKRGCKIAKAKLTITPRSTEPNLDESNTPTVVDSKNSGYDSDEALSRVYARKKARFLSPEDIHC